METKISPAYIFNEHEEAEDAIRKLTQPGFDVKKLSLLGKGYHSEEQPIGFYTKADKIKTWGVNGAFWGGIWGLLMGRAGWWYVRVGRGTFTDRRGR